jgi:hypothetical protein
MRRVRRMPENNNNTRWGLEIDPSEDKCAKEEDKNQG